MASPDRVLEMERCDRRRCESKQIELLGMGEVGSKFRVRGDRLFENEVSSLDAIVVLEMQGMIDVLEREGAIKVVFYEIKK